MKSFPFYKNFEELCKALDSHGAFLAVKDKEGKTNLMTIGWATTGLIWSRPVMTVMVRPVRYTYELMEKTSTFSVCVPDENKLQKELILCGTKSGKNLDKTKEAGLTITPGRLDGSVVVKECKMFYECEIIHKNTVDAKTLAPSIIKDLYPKTDYHVIYYGEIKHSYTV
ncbi:MAG: flavin reductase family protein [bacterium]